MYNKKYIIMVTNIIIDGNSVAFSEYSIFSNYGKDKEPFKKERDQAAYVQGLSNRLFHILNQLPKGGRVIFCLDSRSWRKELMEKYKEKREDADGTKGMMDNETKLIFYSILSEFGEALTRAGIHMSKVQGAEGDDLIFKWVKYFNLKNENCIVISGDRDLTQTVTGPGEPWSIVWDNKSNHNKIFAIPGWSEEIDKPISNSIFDFNPIDDQNTIKKLLRDSGASINTMNISYYLLHKILIGDDGDDVPSSWKVEKENTKGEKKWVRVTDKKAEKIIEILTYPPADRSLSCSEWLDILLHNIDPSKAPMFSDHKSRLDELAGTILRVMDDLDDTNLREKVSENILRNTKLVWLRDEMLPFNINQMINENIENSISSTPTPDHSKWNKNALLEGSKFGKVKIAPRGFDPFNLLELPDED